MGYYTDIELEIVEGDVTVEQFLDRVREIDPEHTLLYAVDDEGNFNNAVKWYDQEESMKKFSLEFPGTVIKLMGDGESTDDMWHEYYKDGKSQHCEVEFVFPPYDETLLK